MTGDRAEIANTHRRCVIPGVIAMCIDDGSEALFGPTLDRLKEAQIPATFFHVGGYLRKNQVRISLGRRAVMEGHSIQV